MSDLLNALNSKMSSTTNEPVKKEQVATETTLERGTNLISQAPGTTKTESSTNTETSVQKEEPSKTTVETDPSTWTLESALKEVKKAREEAKLNRHKYEEAVDTLKKQLDDRVTAVEEKYKPFMQSAKELEDLRKKEEDKKRDVSEKLAHREALLAEYQARLEAVQREFQTKEETYRSQLTRFEAEQKAQQEMYTNKLTEELATIPEKFRSMAELLVKGAGDPRDALVNLSEAKIKGMFEDKVVTVNHSVPGAKDGARLTNEEYQKKIRSELDSMSSSEKIGTALKHMRQGEKNAAFNANLKK